MLPLDTPLEELIATTILEQVVLDSAPDVAMGDQEQVVRETSVLPVITQDGPNTSREQHTEEVPLLRTALALICFILTPP